VHGHGPRHGQQVTILGVHERVQPRTRAKLYADVVAQGVLFRDRGVLIQTDDAVGKKV
jgi:hypothetical protein